MEGSQALMICIISNNSELAKEVQERLSEHNIEVSMLKPTSKASLEALYRQDVMAAVVDAKITAMPEYAWLDMLVTLGRRIPIVVMGAHSESETHTERARYTETLSWLDHPSAGDVIGVLDACGAIGIDHRKLDRTSVPVYNPQVPLHMLQNNGALSVIVVNATGFRKIAIDYGGEAYRRVQDSFHQILYDLWGAPGSFRTSDILCRKSHLSNTYYIFLEQSRSQSGVPTPAVLERLAERLTIKIQNSFWSELFKPRNKRVLPDCISVVPEIAVGFDTAIHNPCVDEPELVEKLIDTAVRESAFQVKRLKNRHKELMQTLIQTPGLLRPNYQAVFHLQNLTKELVEEVQATNSIKPLQNSIYGFESLIRVNQKAMDAAMDDSGITIMESRFMRPDILFSMAHDCKLGLELDQACMHQAVLHSADLQGKLMCNVLPRNLYYIDRLKHLIMDRSDIIFEVSESEAINNFELMLKVREQIEEMNMGIATDDFGKGYAGLEQIIRVKPDVIKLDRSLIQDIHKDKPKQAFVTGLVEAARISNAAMLAEGVELWEEAKLLKSLGIDLIQGFLLHRPQAVEDILKDLQEEQRQPFDTVA